MTNIVFLIRSLDYGGAERQLVAIANGINKEVFNVTVVVFYPNGGLEKELKDDRVQLVCLQKRGRWDSLRFFWRLIGKLRSLRPDVLHGYLGTSNLVISALKPLFPSAKIIWGVFSSYTDWSHYDWFARLTFEFERLLSPFPDLIIANSCSGRAYHLRHGFPPCSTAVIHTGVDVELFKPDSNGRAKVRGEWGIRDDVTLIGLVGRLDPIKDHPTFLKAASILCRARPDVHFACVGAGPADFALELCELTRELKISNRVIWAGARSDMVAVHNALDIASSSSHGEGMPNVIEEAMACGVPCVVTDVGDSAMLIGETGIVVPPKNPEALAAGWLSCLEGNVRLKGRKARSRVTELFNLKAMVEQTEKAILSTLSRPKNPTSVSFKAMASSHSSERRPT